MTDRIVLAYSGGPASSVAIPWLRERHHAEIVTLTVDVGQRELLEGIRQRALACGAVRAHVLDRRDRFAREYLLPAVRSGEARRENPADAPAPGWPLVAEGLVEIARIEGARTVAHGAMGPGDRERMLAVVQAIAPDLQVLAAAADWSLGLEGMAEYARQRGIPFTLVDPPAPARAVRPAAPARVAIDFRAGVPVNINGVEMDLVDLLASLETIAAAQGVTGAQVLGAAYQALPASPAPDGLAEVTLSHRTCEVVTRGN